MTSADPTSIEGLVRDALDRLDRQERRTAALESMLGQAPSPPVTDTHPVSTLPTPIQVPRPPRRQVPAGGASRQAPAAGDRQAPTATASGGGFPVDVLASLDLVVWSISPDGQVVFHIAGAVQRTYGRLETDFLARAGVWLDAVPVSDRPALRSALRQLAAADQFTLGHRIETPAGHTRWVVSRGQLVRDPEGRPVRVDGTTTDVTTRVGTETTGLGILRVIGPVTGADFLAAAVEQLSTSFGTRAAAIVVLDPIDPGVAHTRVAWVDGRAVGSLTFPTTGKFIQSALAGMSQFVPSAARDRFPTDDFLAHFRAEAVATEPLADAAGLLLGFVAVLDDRATRPGTPDIRAVLRAVLRAIAPRLSAELTRPVDQRDQVRDLETQLAELTHRAEAQAREAAEQLRQSRRLETVGRLVAGVAHDFNNLLTIISGNAELLRESLPHNDPLRGPAELIEATAHTAAGVARQLVSFGKPTAAESCLIDPNVAIQAVQRMLRRLVGDRVEIDILLAPGTPPVRVAPGQFDQVILNLVANARDAIADDGSITVRTAEATIRPDRPGWPTDLSIGSYVALTVTDTGCGMTDDVRVRMFDPFFTTKGVLGTGLGLATVRDIVREASGHIEVESSPEWGTSVRVYWPRAEGPTARSGPRPIPAGRGETVLLVQDEQAVRDVGAVALHLAGYRVLEAADGVAGEERANLYTGPIDLLVTDLGLPRQGGLDLAARARSNRPGMKVLYVSGYPTPDTGGDPFLAKPYTPTELLFAVRAAIDSTAQE